MKKTTLPNIITAARLPLSAAMLFTEAFSTPFYAVYTLGGLTDVLDGAIARRTDSESEFGAKLDSIADLAFTAAALIKIAPKISLDTWLWIWIAAIAAVRIFNIACGVVREKKLIMPHTKANKLTGLLLFLLGYVINTASLAAVPVCAVASFAAVQEGHFIRTDS